MKDEAVRASSISFRRILFESLRIPFVLATGHGYDRPPWLNNLHHKLAYRLHKMLPVFGISGTQRISVPVQRELFMYVRAEDGGVAHQLLMYQQYEPFESQLVQQYLKPGMTIYNIGANLGYYVLLSSKCIGSTGKVFAFEPEAANLELLHRTVSENMCRNIEILPVAVSSQSGTATLSLSQTNSGDHQLNAIADRAQIPVPTVSIDEFIAQGHAPPDVIIMDVQGSELDVLRGAKTILAQRKPLILFMEYWPSGLNARHVNGAMELLDILERAGFHLARIDERAQQLISVRSEALLREVTGTTEVNLLALRT